MTIRKNGAVLLKWWPVIVLLITLVLAIIGGAIAWGANLEKITEHSRRLKINEKTIKKLSEGRARIDERTKAILRSQSNTEQNIRAILRQLQSGRRPVQ